MASQAEELTVNYAEDGAQTGKERDKVILSKGAWATVLFRFQELGRQKNEFGADKFTIRRYQKRHGEYQQKSKFNISSRDQAAKIVEALNGWLAE